MTEEESQAEMTESQYIRMFMRNNLTIEIADIIHDIAKNHMKLGRGST